MVLSQKPVPGYPDITRPGIRINVNFKPVLRFSFIQGVNFCVSKWKKMEAGDRIWHTI
jgi:hypothetical protein